MRTTFRTLAVIAFVVGTVAYGQDLPEKKARTLEVPEGSFTWKEWPGTEGQFATFVRALTPGELESLDRDADRAEGFIEKYAPKDRRSEDLLENLDEAFAVWQKHAVGNRESSDEVIKVTGAAYGRYCIKELGLKWAIVRDEQGTATALVGDRPSSRSFPFTSIQYRIEDGKSDFFVALFVTLRQLRQEAKN
jgi:Domain of unknown function (DUF3806)